MRHLVDHRKLGRTGAHRMAMLKNMVVSLIRHGRIRTTVPKAKELRRLADRLVTLGKRGTVDARRRARQYLHDREAITKLFGELAPRFANRKGGYTRILKLNFRDGDQAPLALIEYLDNPPPAPKLKGAKETSQKKAKSAKQTKRVAP